MTNRDFEILYKKIGYEVANKEMNSALLHLKEMIIESGNLYLEDQRSDIEKTYLNMLNYAVSNIHDPEQDSIYNKIQKKALDLADVTRDLYFTKTSNNIIYQYKRTSSLPQSNLNEETYSSDDLAKVFYKLWLTEKYDSELTAKIRTLFAKSEISANDKSTFVSAIMLGLIRSFDEDKFHLLLDFLSDPNKAIGQRALIALIFCSNIHSARIPLYKQLQSRIGLTFQDEEIAESLQSAIIQLLISKETDKITKKMKEAIPDIMKDTSLRDLKREKVKLEDLLNEESEMSGINPKWQSLLENAGVSDKMMELSQLQMEGGDIFMSTFAPLKNYAFFNNIENWFLPFYHAEIAQKYATDAEATSQLASMLDGSVFLCNSDKYSMLFSVNEMPSHYLDMIKGTFKMEKEQLEEAKRDERITDAHFEEKAFARMYIQDLFRFYNLFSYKNDFSNPFLSIKDLHQNLLIRGNSKSESIEKTIIDFYIKKEYYPQAIQLLKVLEAAKPADLDIVQKLAYCYQQTKDYKKAIAYYNMAETIKPETSWNLQRLAYCQKQAGDYQGSLGNYQRCASLEPDNLNIQANIGYCLINLKQYQEALKIFFKIDYLEPENKKAAKAIGWCSFETGKLEQAEKYYKKTAETGRDSIDWMNIGHILLCQNKKEESIYFYKQAYLKMDSDKKKFCQLFLEDKDSLVKNGLEESNHSFLRDYLLYKIEEQG